MYPEIGEDMIKIPERLRSKAENIDEFCNEIFPDIKNVVKDGLKKSFNDDEWISWITSRAIICPINEDCEEINEKMIKKIDGQLFMSKSIDKVHDEQEAHNYPTEFLNSLRLPSYPSHIIELKRGVPFMLLRNLDPKNGHVNGARYIVKSFSQRIIHGRLAVGPHKGNEILLPKILLHVKDKQLPFEFSRKQFPIRPSFAFTTHKSQGQSLKSVGIYLKHDMFGHGMLYVSTSRVTQPHALKIYKPKKQANVPPPKKSNDVTKIKNNKKKMEETPTLTDEIFTRNVVYQEIYSKSKEISAILIKFSKY